MGIPFVRVIRVRVEYAKQKSECVRNARSGVGIEGLTYVSYSVVENLPILRCLSALAMEVDAGLLEVLGGLQESRGDSHHDHGGDGRHDEDGEDEVFKHGNAFRRGLLDYV